MATVLASAICSEGIMNLQQDVTPWTPFGALDHVISAHITTAEITQFTTISANSDTHIGNLITQALPSPHFFTNPHLPPQVTRHDDGTSPPPSPLFYY